MCSEWDLEVERLKKTEVSLRKEIFQRLELREGNMGEMRQINSDMWEDLGLLSMDNVYEYLQQIKFLQQNVASSSKVQKELKMLEKQLYSPYFCRIDFQEDGWEKESIYIGMYGLRDSKTQEILICDWRSPISSIFYDYELGNAKYNSPSGDIYGEVLLKRQFRIENAKLILMFDSDLAIEDDVLQDILAASADGEMKTIVKTIQKEQNRAIRYEDKKVLIVQGPAGSGKTSIALHRAAYLLYRNRNHLSTKNIRLFTPNDIFAEYISNVLPELGEDELESVTLTSLAQEILGVTYSKYEVFAEFMDNHLLEKNHESFSGRNNNVVKLKGSIDFIELIENYIKKYEEELVKFDDIKFNGELLATKEELEELFHHSFKHMLVAKRFARMDLTIQPRITKKRQEIEEEKLKIIAESGEYIDGSEMKAVARMQAIRELEPAVERLRGVLTIKIDRLYNDFLSYIKIPEKDNVDEPRKVLKFEDQGPILYMMAILGLIDADKDVKQLIVDEAQDYSCVVFKLFSKLYPSSAVTLLGDSSQNINPIFGVGSLKLTGNLINKEYEYIELNKSYRSTVEIVNFAERIFNLNKNINGSRGVPYGSHAIPFGRHGNEPEMLISENINGVYSNVGKSLERSFSKNYKTIAIVCRTAIDSKTMYNNIKSDFHCQLIIESDAVLSERVVVLPAYLAKGLEFDAVIITVGSVQDYTKNEEHLLYTACTRALHELYICSIEGNPFIEKLV